MLAVESHNASQRAKDSEDFCNKQKVSVGHKTFRTYLVTELLVSCSTLRDIDFLCNSCSMKRKLENPSSVYSWLEAAVRAEKEKNQVAVDNVAGKKWAVHTLFNHDPSHVLTPLELAFGYETGDFRPSFVLPRALPNGPTLSVGCSFHT